MRIQKSKEVNLDSKHQSKNKTWVQENKKRYCLYGIAIKSKPKLLPNSQPGVYQLDCSCNGKYNSESKKRVLTWCIEHQQDSMCGKWESFVATEHTKECHGQFNWLHPNRVCISPYRYERKIHDALQINKLKTINEKDKSFTVLNRDNGDYLKTNSWKPLFMKMENH